MKYSTISGTNLSSPYANGCTELLRLVGSTEPDKCGHANADISFDLIAIPSSVLSPIERIGIISAVDSTTLPYVAAFLAALVIASLIANKFKPGLSDIPGPPLAAYTKLRRLYNVRQGSAHLTAIELHRKYGKLVRIAPNVVSVGDAAEIPKIYNIKGDYTKSGFYPIQCVSWQKKPQMNLFSTRDETEHREQKKKVANAYSLESLLKMEPAIDDCSRIFIDKLGGIRRSRQASRLGQVATILRIRHVPLGVDTTCGKFLPGVTIVGVNPWVTQRDPDVFPNPDFFVPKRWLDASPEQLSAMEKSFFSFGAGSRACIGTNISLIEMSFKIIPQLLRTFNIEMAGGLGAEWKVTNVWFTQQEMWVELLKT